MLSANWPDAARPFVAVLCGCLALRLSAMAVRRRDTSELATTQEVAASASARVRRSSGPVVGIDLGTTYSAVAYVNELGKPEIVPNREGENITPSVVLFDGEQPIVGTMAKRSVLAAPLDTVQFVKRSMGDPAWHFETTGGTSYRPEEISALILKRLKSDASRALGTEVIDAVITVPAYFDDAPRRATIDAGTMAGLNVLRVLNEPTAAALAFGVSGRATDETLLVYDLGGGTFDVTAMRIEGGEFTVLATMGDRNLGGFDFDNLLMTFLNERFVAAGGPSLLDDDLTEANLREKAELAKHSLSAIDRTVVALTAGGFSRTIPVTRAEFEDVCSSLLSRTRDIAQLVMEDAGLTRHTVDRVLLAGGSTRMPMVQVMLHKLTAIRPDASANPDEVVAQGAAIQANLIEKSSGLSPSQVVEAQTSRTNIRIQDVTSQGLGKIFYSPLARRDINEVIIPRNTPIPASGSTTAHTKHAHQEAISNQITQGDDPDVSYVRIVGEQTFPIPDYPTRSEFETILTYDIDQIIRIEIVDCTTGRSVGTFDIDNTANMSSQAVNTSSQRIRAIQVD